ncbi:hypothetical protein TNCV_2611041 [Trichonephila clavipes]|nr:hypothetical protein TNCV_2611041 [Trichonephila clavipes]
MQKVNACSRTSRVLLFSLSPLYVQEFLFHLLTWLRKFQFVLLLSCACAPEDMCFAFAAATTASSDRTRSAKWVELHGDQRRIHRKHTKKRNRQGLYDKYIEIKHIIIFLTRQLSPSCEGTFLDDPVPQENIVFPASRYKEY